MTHEEQDGDRMDSDLRTGHKAVAAATGVGRTSSKQQDLETAAELAKLLGYRFAAAERYESGTGQRPPRYPEAAEGLDWAGPGFTFHFTAPQIDILVAEASRSVDADFDPETLTSIGHSDRMKRARAQRDMRTAWSKAGAATFVLEMLFQSQKPAENAKSPKREGIATFKRDERESPADQDMIGYFNEALAAGHGEDGDYGSLGATLEALEAVDNLGGDGARRRNMTGTLAVRKATARPNVTPRKKKKEPTAEAEAPTFNADKFKMFTTTVGRAFARQLEAQFRQQPAPGSKRPAAKSAAEEQAHVEEQQHAPVKARQGDTAPQPGHAPPPPPLPPPPGQDRKAEEVPARRANPFAGADFAAALQRKKDVLQETKTKETSGSGGTVLDHVVPAPANPQQREGTGPAQPNGMMAELLANKIFQGRQGAAGGIIKAPAQKKAPVKAPPTTAESAPTPELDQQPQAGAQQAEAQAPRRRRPWGRWFANVASLGIVPLVRRARRKPASTYKQLPSQ